MASNMKSLPVKTYVEQEYEREKRIHHKGPFAPEDIVVGPVGLATGEFCNAGFVVRYVPKKLAGVSNGS